MGRLIINGDEVYELDEKCLKEKQGQNMQIGEGYRYTQQPEGRQAAAGHSGKLSYAAVDSTLHRNG